MITQTKSGTDLAATGRQRQTSGASPPGVARLADGEEEGRSRAPEQAVVDLRLDRITKRYGNVEAVREVSIAVQRGEFVSLLGPSGCGKTTTLSMIAGFQGVTGGAIYIGERRVDALPAEKRNTGMVFQNYALFPHMTVAQNVAFGLRMRRVAKAETADRVTRALAMVRMAGFEDRQPSQMSGGQQQRVALARALVIEPEILLLDEPFGALDRQLREQMQLELKTLQRSVGITTVFVTHDQEEALSMSDRVAVMNQGIVEQIGKPGEVYERPATRFVAGFIGKSNLIAGRIRDIAGDRVLIETPLGTIAAARPARSSLAEGAQVELLVRPEKLLVGRGEATGPGWNEVTCSLRQIAYHGASTEIHLEGPGGTALLATEPNRTAAGLLDGSLEQRVTLRWPMSETLIFHQATRCA